jgi:putative membrane protein
METGVKKKASATDFLANERTFVAWIRTGIAIMVFGFVAVKFGLFLNQVKLMSSDNVVLPNADYSYWIGISLVVLGTTMSVLAFLRYRQVEHQLNENHYHSTTILSLLLTTCILFVGILLLIYLS